MLLASLEILSDLKSCSSPESAALEEIFNAGGMQLSKNQNLCSNYGVTQTPPQAHTCEVEN